MATRDVFARLENHIHGSIPLPNAGAAVLIALGVVLAALFYQYYQSTPDISHIPILGAELGLAGRKEAFAKDCMAFLKRGYDQVPLSSPIEPLNKNVDVAKYNKRGKAFQIETTMGEILSTGK